MKRFRFHPEAQIEMVESAKYYETEQEGLGKLRLKPPSSVLSCIARLPDAGRLPKFPRFPRPPRSRLGGPAHLSVLGQPFPEPSQRAELQ
jgi:hypothetical protein